MRSRVAEEVREAQREEIMRMTVEERVALARQLRERGLAGYMAEHGVSRDEAVARIRKQRQTGRRPSRCMSE